MHQIKRFHFLCALSLSVLLSGCSRDDSPIAVEVESLLDEFDAALNSMDLDTIMSFYAEDIVVLEPGRPVVEGWDATYEWTADTLDQYVLVEHHYPEETLDYGDIVLHRGNARGSLTPRDGGEPMEFDNKYIHIFRRASNGELKLVWGAFNANGPQ